VCLLVWQNFVSEHPLTLIGHLIHRYLPCPDGGWRLLSPDTVIAQREVPPVAVFRTGDGARRNRRLSPLGYSVPQRRVLLLTNYPNVLSVDIRQHNKSCGVMMCIQLNARNGSRATFNIFISIYYTLYDGCTHTIRYKILYTYIGNDTMYIYIYPF